MRDYLLSETVKEIIVEMAVSDELPSDLTTLDIQSIFSEAKERLSKNQLYVLLSKLDKLGRYVSADGDDELRSMLDLLEGHNNPSDMVDLVDGVQICERYEYSFTVKDLLKEIS